MPLGTIGGIGFSYFPLDAEYEFKTETWDSSSAARVVFRDWNSRIRSKSQWMARKVCSATVGGTEFNDLNYRSTADAMKAAEGTHGGAGADQGGPARRHVRSCRPAGAYGSTCSRRFAPLPMPRRPLARPGSQRCSSAARESSRARGYAEPPEDLRAARPARAMSSAAPRRFCRRSRAGPMDARSPRWNATSSSPSIERRVPTRRSTAPSRPRYRASSRARIPDPQSRCSDAGGRRRGVDYRRGTGLTSRAVPLEQHS